MLVLLNTGDDPGDPAKVITSVHQNTLIQTIQGRLEMEISQLAPDEAAMFIEEFGITELAASRIIQASYKLVNLQSFFTVGEDEVRAWNVPVGATAVEAAGVIHTDLSRGFIRAEVVGYNTLIEAGSMAAARKAGHVTLEGKEYLVKDGDIMHIRHSS